jgi:hypothetical protein
MSQLIFLEKKHNKAVLPISAREYDNVWAEVLWNSHADKSAQKGMKIPLALFAKGGGI